MPGQAELNDDANLLVGQPFRLGEFERAESRAHHAVDFAPFDGQLNLRRALVSGDCLEFQSEEIARQNSHIRRKRSDRDAAGRKVNAVIRNLDADGRWLADGRLQKNTPVEKVISTKVVIANGNGRCDYLVSRAHAAGRAP